MCNENLNELTEQEQMELDEFEKMLNEFIEGEFEKELNKQRGEDDEHASDEQTEEEETQDDTIPTIPQHKNIRGKEYYS